MKTYNVTFEAWKETYATMYHDAGEDMTAEQIDAVNDAVKKSAIYVVTSNKTPFERLIAGVTYPKISTTNGELSTVFVKFSDAFSKKDCKDSVKIKMPADFFTYADVMRINIIRLENDAFGSDIKVNAKIEVSHPYMTESSVGSIKEKQLPLVVKMSTEVFKCQYRSDMVKAIAKGLIKFSRNAGIKGIKGNTYYNLICTVLFFGYHGIKIKEDYGFGEDAEISINDAIIAKISE